MICPKCKVEMVKSKAIRPKLDDPYARYIVQPDLVLKPHEIRLIDCLKCPICGYSDATEEQLKNGEPLL